MFMYARRQHNKAHKKEGEKGKSCSKIPEIHVNLDNLKYKRMRNKINCVN